MRLSLLKKSALICVYLWLISLFFCVPAAAQVRPVNDYGALGLGRFLKRLNTTASVMMIGAHPDDEDSALIAYLARGENARTAYLSLTRGDGGQNIIGPELFESLGIIRTEELLQARRLDGAEQYFSRAYDYGFSKTLDEAKRRWPEEVIKCDVVRAIRKFRPLVVISRFSGTPADGHGQHQYAGYISPIAVKAAADTKQCTDAGSTWKVLKFYVEQGFRSDTEPTLRINTGQYDPLLGRTYFEIAMEGRSQHKSQGEGRIEYHGDQFSGLNLVGAAKDKREKSIFDGLNTGPRIVIHNFLDNPDFAKPQTRVLSGLAFLYKEARSKIDTNRVKELLKDTAAAIKNAAGIQIDALADEETVVPGGDLIVSTKIFLPKSDAAKISDITLTAPDGWIITKTDPPKQNNAAYNNREIGTASAVFKVTVAKDIKPTQPYWLESPREANLFAWPKTASRTLPFDPQQLIAHVTVVVSGTEIVLDQPVQFRYADSVRGEIRREVNVVPKLSVETTPNLLIVPHSDKTQTRQITMRVTNNQLTVGSGSTDLKLPTGWSVNRSFGILQTGKRGEQTSFSYDLTIPGGTATGSYQIDGTANLSGEFFSQTMTTISYPHIQTHRFYTKAETTVKVLDLKVEPVNVGYIMGSGDEVPEAIRQMGLVVTMLEEKDLASGELSKYDSIVVGIRASETRPDFVANNARLLEYVKNGGNMIVQYQRGNWTALAPYAASTADTQQTAAGSIARVVDENAQVTILKPDDAIFNFPNEISNDDFASWVQERNAYNFVTFDPQYTPLLESHDTGEMENKGGLVTAKVGKGSWTYCSYSMFRQLPAGVGGAYRLFANLLSQPNIGK